MKLLNACKNCHILTKETVCPKFAVPNLKRMQRNIIIRDPVNSQIAKKMNINKPGKYALKVK